MKTTSNNKKRKATTALQKIKPRRKKHNTLLPTRKCTVYRRSYTDVCRHIYLYISCILLFHRRCRPKQSREPIDRTTLQNEQRDRKLDWYVGSCHIKPAYQSLDRIISFYLHSMALYCRTAPDACQPGQYVAYNCILLAHEHHCVCLFRFSIHHHGYRFLPLVGW